VGLTIRVLFAAWLVVIAPAPDARSADEDGITFKSIQVRGTMKERDIPAWTPLTVEVGKKAGVTVQLDFGDNKKLQEQAAKTVGKRVVVEGRGEYRLVSTQVIIQMCLFVVVEKIEVIEDK
jgi:hypothetical protein